MGRTLFDHLDAPSPSLRIKLVASSSAGNAMALHAGDDVLLLDAGVAAGRVEAALHDEGLSYEHVRGVVVTHAHGDHVAGLPRLMRRLGPRAPLVMSPATLRQLVRQARFQAWAGLLAAAEDSPSPPSFIGHHASRPRFSSPSGPPFPTGPRRPWFADGQAAAATASQAATTSQVRAHLAGLYGTNPLPIFVPLTPSEPLTLGCFTIAAVPTPHDLAGCVALSIEAGGKRLVVATDLGHATARVGALFRDADCAVLEANHCPQLLAASPYPVSVQRRIQSDRGHLSNEQAAAILVRYASARVIAAHLSDKANTPQRAFDVLRAGLDQRSATRACALEIAPPHEPTAFFAV
mgnify:CR=1 FL=1